VWALKRDVELAEAAQSRRQLSSPQVSNPRPDTELVSETRAEQEARTGHELATELHDPRACRALPAPGAPTVHSDGSTEPASAENDEMAVTDSAPRSRSKHRCPGI